MKNPYSPPKTDGKTSARLSRTTIFVTQVIARHCSTIGIAGLTMAFVCAVVALIQLFAGVICWIYVWENPGAGLAMGAMIRGASCLFGSLLAVITMQSWWQERFRLALFFSAALFVLSSFTFWAQL